MRKKFEPAFLIAIYVSLFIIVAHLILGYVFPKLAVLIIALQFITVYMMNKRWLLISWIILVLGSYITIDVLTYNPDGISATLYSYMLSIMLAQLYSILLSIACIVTNSKVYKNTIISDNKRIIKIRGSLSVYSFYALPAVVCIVLSSMYYNIKNVNGVGNMYFISGLIAFIVMCALHVYNYMYTVSLIRAINKYGRKEDTSNEVFEESNNGESI